MPIFKDNREQKIVPAGCASCIRYGIKIVAADLITKRNQKIVSVVVLKRKSRMQMAETTMLPW